MLNTIRKLGAKPPRHDPRTLKLSRYLLPSTLPPAPASQDWMAAVGKGNWGKMLNDRIGCCGIAGIGHKIQAWTAAHGQIATVPDAAIAAGYTYITGVEGQAYDPTTGTGDNGIVLLDALVAWRKLGFYGHKIAGFAKVDMTDQREVQEAIYLFGSLYTGVDLPAAWQSSPTLWSAPPRAYHFGHRQWQPGSWGGHCVMIGRYKPSPTPGAAPIYGCVSWGDEIDIQGEALPAYWTEGYVVVSEDWVSGAMPAPNGIDFDALMTDIGSFGPVS